MGADGGTIPTRGEMVKEKKRDVKLDPKIGLDAKWKTCKISSAPLAEPVVACELGRLYNKEAVLEFLLSRADQPPARIEMMKHVRKMSDVVELKLTRSTDYKDVADSSFSDRGNSAWCCPITSLPMNGINRFVFSRHTGTVVSERALKEVPDACVDLSDPADAIIINGTPAEVAELWVRMDERRRAAKAARKAAKKAAKGESMPPPSGSTAAANGAKPADRTSKHASTPGINKSAPGQAGKATTSTRPIKTMTINGPGLDALKHVKSIPTVTEDPRASKVLKSLFTSSKGTHDGKTYTSRGGARW